MYNMVVSAMSFLPMDWDLGTALGNVRDSFYQWGSVFLTVVGTVMLIVAGVKLAKRLMFKNAQQEVKWLDVILLVLFGVGFMVSGIVWLYNLGQIGKTTIATMGLPSSEPPDYSAAMKGATT